MRMEAEPWNDGDKLNYPIRNTTIESGGRAWQLRVVPLATDCGVSVHLSEPDAPAGENFLLDWRDILNTASTARMHFFPGMPKDGLGFGEKKRRMTLFSQAIICYGRMMDMVWPTDLEGVRARLDVHRLPTPQTVVIETSNLGLCRLFTALNYPVPPSGMGFHVPWAQLKGDAESGSFLDTWLKQKLDGASQA